MIIRAIDVETTGLDPTDEVVEIAAYHIHDGHLYTTPYHAMVKPARSIPVTACAVHHITDADVAEAPPWNTAIARRCGRDQRAAHRLSRQKATAASAGSLSEAR